LSKCYDQTIRERQLQALANIDADLCQKVADGLGLPAPTPTVHIHDVPVSAALTQIGESWPVAGRQIGIIVGDGVDVTTVTTVTTVAKARAGGRRGAPGCRTARRHDRHTDRPPDLRQRRIHRVRRARPHRRPTTRTRCHGQRRHQGRRSSISHGPTGREAGQRAWRHSKAIGAIGANTALTDAGATPEDAGIVVGTAKQLAPALLDLLAHHRAWDRFATSQDL